MLRCWSGLGWYGFDAANLDIHFDHEGRVVKDEITKGSVGLPGGAVHRTGSLYYCQGWHLAWYAKPLFVESLEAWKDGPVVPCLYYNDLANKGRAPINENEIQIECEALSLSHDEKRAIKQFGHITGNFRPSA